MLLLPSHVYTAHWVGLAPKCAEHTALRKKHMEKLPLLEAGTSHSLSWHAQVHKGKVMSQRPVRSRNRTQGRHGSCERMLGPQ